MVNAVKCFCINMRNRIHYFFFQTKKKQNSSRSLSLIHGLVNWNDTAGLFCSFFILFCKFIFVLRFAMMPIQFIYAETNTNDIKKTELTEWGIYLLSTNDDDGGDDDNNNSNNNSTQTNMINVYNFSTFVYLFTNINRNEHFKFADWFNALTRFLYEKGEIRSAKNLEFSQLWVLHFAKSRLLLMGLCFLSHWYSISRSLSPFSSSPKC